MIEEKNEVWEGLKRSTLKYLWLRVISFVALVVFDILWLTKEQFFISEQTDAIISSIGFVTTIVIGLWIFFDTMIFWRPWTKTKEVEINREQQSGRVLIKDNELIWQDIAGKEIGKIPLDKVKVIAEYTTSDGPYVDDWFYLFILSQTDLRQISAYATNINAVLESLSSKYNCDIVGHLAHSATFDSNVLWPKGLSGTKVYEVLAKQKPTTIWERLMATFGLAKGVGLSTELKKYLS